MQKTRPRIPANPAARHGTRSLDRTIVAGVEADIKRASIEVLAILGDTKMGASQHLIGLTRAVGREYGGAHCPDRVHDAGQKIEHADIDPRLLTGMVVPQE